MVATTADDVSGDTGHVLELENKETGVTAKFEQDFAFYKSYASQPDMDKLRRLSLGARETSQRQGFGFQPELWSVHFSQQWHHCRRGFVVDDDDGIEARACS